MDPRYLHVNYVINCAVCHLLMIIYLLTTSFRLLSREGTKVAPGSTIASLMAPHPAVNEGEREGHREREWGEERKFSLEGTTM